MEPNPSSVCIYLTKDASPAFSKRGLQLASDTTATAAAAAAAHSPQVGATAHGAHEKAALTLHHLLRAQTCQRGVMDSWDQKVRRNRLSFEKKQRPAEAGFTCVIGRVLDKDFKQTHN